MLNERTDTQEDMTMRTLWPLALAAAISASLIACKSDEQHLDVTVNWNDTKQTIDGFGAASVFFGGNISDDIADLAFDSKKGIGLSLLRIQIGLPADINWDDGSEPEDAVPVATVPELTTAQQAIARGAKVWAAAWTPPPIWKTTNSKNGSQTDPEAGPVFESNKLKTEHYQDYADYLADYVEYLAENDVPLVGLSAANEPDYIATWDNAQWSPDEYTDFILHNMGPTFEERCPSVKIVAPDTADWPSVDKYITPLLNDSAGKDYLGIVATHPYQNSSDPIDLGYDKPQQNGKPFWQSEWSQEKFPVDTPDPSMTSAINMVEKLHDHMTISNLNAWSWWSVYVDAEALTKYSSPGRQNPALIQPDESLGEPFMFKRGYAFGNWSKFVRPGFKRITATDRPLKQVLIEAYRDDSNHLAVIAVNTSNSVVTQNFLMDGGSFGDLTPWVTSPNDDLASKDSFNGGEAFTYDLPAQSVVTFVNWDANDLTPGLEDLAPPETHSGLDCENAIVPNNLVEGGVTDFTDWDNSSGRWGDNDGLWGNIYGYKDQTSSMNGVIDAETNTFHATGAVSAGEYGGIGLAFASCTTVASFSQVEFTMSGTFPGCDMQLQIKTFDQQPDTQTPPGGCDPDGAEGCYNFPAMMQVATESDETVTVTVPLADIDKWSEDNAKQVIGIQWQWTTNDQLDPDSDVGCPIDVKISDVKFLE